MIDEFRYELGKRAASGGGEAVLIDKTISSNGTYNASSDNADGYKKAVVNVPNSYAAGDEGKVVSNGALVAQGSETVTQNGTVNTTLISSLNVNVSGGGGSNWTLLASQEFSVNTSSTSATSVGDIQLDLSDYNDPNTVLLVHIRDKAGKRTGHSYGSDTVFFHWQLANNNTNVLSTRPAIAFGVNSEDKYNAFSSSSGVGVYASNLYYSNSNHFVSITSKYNSTYGTINGTFKCDVYKLTMPSGVTLFETS